MEYISNRNITVASTTGHSVEFKKGIPTNCSSRMHAELLALGIVPVDPIEPEAEAQAGAEPTDPAAREAALFTLYEKLILRNARKDFTAVGSPHLSVIAKETGWPEIDGKERDSTWAKFNQAQADKAKA